MNSAQAKKKPTITQVLNALERQILFGKTYFAISRGLLKAEPVVYGTASTFFGLTADGCLELAAMTIAHLYDRSKGSVTIPRMLQRAEAEISSFHDRLHVRKAIAGATAIKRYRDEWFAHLDPNTVADPEALNAAANVTILDLDRAFEETEGIIKELTRLLEKQRWRNLGRQRAKRPLGCRKSASSLCKRDLLLS
jgi:AbiU2